MKKRNHIFCVVVLIFTTWKSSYRSQRSFSYWAKLSGNS